MASTTLAERVELLVRLSGLDRKGLSIAAGLAQSHVGMIIRGEISSPERETIEKLADATQADPAWIFFGVGTPPAPEQVHAAPAVKLAHAARASEGADDAPAVDAEPSGPVHVGDSGRANGTEG